MGTFYSIGDAAKELGLTASALRFYDKNELLPHMERSQGGMRVFTEDDLEWIRFIERLKKSGMPIKEIKQYIDLYLQGDSTIEERRQIVYQRKEEVERQLEDLQLTLDFISYKCWFYDVASESGTTDTPRNMPLEDLPEDIRKTKERCGIHRY